MIECQRMVEKRITDGKRVAQLFASELSGLDVHPLDEIEVVDADPDAEPTPDGTLGYRVNYRETTVASVVLYPERAELRLDTAAIELGELTNGTDRMTIDGDTATVSIESGAAVKRAVDTLRDALSVY